MPATEQAFSALNALFKSHNKELWMVGGAVRDYIRGEIPLDIDFCTNATPNEMIAIVESQDYWKYIPTGLQHGTITFMSLFGCFEVTTLRKDINCDGRHAEVEFTNSLLEDAKRRDFTMNALYMDINGKIIDFFDGKEHIKSNTIRFIGDANDRIKEDALRIMRFFRFCAKDDMKFLPKDFNAIINNVNLLKDISVERVWDEIKKATFKSPDRMDIFFNLAYMTGAMEALNIPGERPFVGINKVKATLGVYPAIFPEFYMAAVIKDSRKAAEFSKKFKLSTAERNNLLWYSKMINTYTFETFTKTIVEDEINAGTNKSHLESFASYLNNGLLEERIKSIPKSKFPVTGADLIALGYKEGVKLGQKLSTLREIWKNSRYTATKNDLLKIYK